MVQNNHKLSITKTIVCENAHGQAILFYLRSQSHMMTHVNQAALRRPHSIDDSQMHLANARGKMGLFPQSIYDQYIYL